jgi:hypothetical protein
MPALEKDDLGIEAQGEKPFAGSASMPGYMQRNSRRTGRATGPVRDDATQLEIDRLRSG